jgi:predicted peptidase
MPRGTSRVECVNSIPNLQLPTYLFSASAHYARCVASAFRRKCRRAGSFLPPKGGSHIVVRQNTQALNTYIGSWKLIHLFSALLILPSTVDGQIVETGFLNRTLRLDGTTYKYQVYVPATYESGTLWPVILFLHGAGERGEDGLLQTEVGLGSAIRRRADRYPAIVVFPQTRREANWQGASARMALAALDRTLAEFPSNPKRVYLTGISMGGNGAWYLAYHHGDRFAAVAVICGFVSPGGPFPGILSSDVDEPFKRIAERVKQLPVWIVHGDADPVVPVSESQGMYAALSAAGARVRYVELPGVGHNSWDKAYGATEFTEWLFAQRSR